MKHEYTRSQLKLMSWPDKIEAALTNKLNMTSYRLKHKLIELGYKENRCEICKLSEWMGHNIPLELHHINANHLDNSLENLQILCSNCHSLTPNFCGGMKRCNKLNKTIPEYRIAIESSTNIKQACELLNIVPKGGNYQTIRNICRKYGFKFKEPLAYEIIDKVKKFKEPYSRNKFKTKEEAYFAQCKVKNRPSKEELLKMIWEDSGVQIGKRYGVSSGAIKKWCESYVIPFPGVGYWAKYKANHVDECLSIKKELFNKFNIPLI